MVYPVDHPNLAGVETDRVLVCVRLFGNLGEFEASVFKIFQALPLADLALQEQGESEQ